MEHRHHRHGRAGPTTDAQSIWAPRLLCLETLRIKKGGFRGFFGLQALWYLCRIAPGLGLWGSGIYNRALRSEGLGLSVLARPQAVPSEPTASGDILEAYKTRTTSARDSTEGTGSEL